MLSRRFRSKPQIRIHKSIRVYVCFHNGDGNNPELALANSAIRISEQICAGENPRLNQYLFFA
jgi:hypothetical protein